MQISVFNTLQAFCRQLQLRILHVDCEFLPGCA